jgi:hypothetical protein
MRPPALRYSSPEADLQLAPSNERNALLRPVGSKENLIMATTAREITWRHDFDAALSDASKQQRAVLLDFSAAPM